MSWKQNLLYGVTSHKDNQLMGIHQMCKKKGCRGSRACETLTLTSTSSQWKKWMSGLCWSLSWHTSSSTDGYRVWFRTVWLMWMIERGKFSNSSCRGTTLATFRDKSSSSFTPSRLSSWQPQFQTQDLRPDVVSYLCVAVQQPDRLVCDLQKHLLGPDLVFGVQ